MALKPAPVAFTLDQLDTLQNALLNRSAKASSRSRSRMSRVANDSRLFNRFIANKATDFAKANPKATPAEIFQMILDFINNGGLDNLLAAILKIIALFGL